MSWKQSKVHHYSPVGEEDRILADKKPDIEELLLLGQRATVSHLQQGPVVSLQHPLSLIPAPVSVVTVPKDVLAKANTHLVKVEAPQPGPSSSSAPLVINSSQQELLSRNLSFRLWVCRLVVVEGPEHGDEHILHGDVMKRRAGNDSSFRKISLGKCSMTRAVDC